MSVVKINAITLGEGKGPELEARFGSRAREVVEWPDARAVEEVA